MWTTLIRPSWRLGINSLSGRRVRTALLIGAVTLAVSLIVGISTCMQSVRNSIESRLLETLGASDARLIHRFGGRFDEAWLERIEQWPGVERAVGRYTGSLTLVRADGRRDPETGLEPRTTPLAHGIDVAAEPALRPLRLSEGRFPHNDGEVLIDAIVADELDAGIDDVLEVQRFGEPILLRVVGIFERPILGMLQRPQVLVSRATLEEATGRRGEISDIAIELDTGIEIESFCAAHAEEVPQELALEPAEMARTGFDRRIDAGDLMFVLLSMMAFVVCSFLIVIGMTTGVTERQRELGITRCMGATRMQVFASQILVGLLMGVVGALIGIPLGIALASALVLYFDEFLTAGVSVGGLGIVLGACGALVAGTLGALFPAIQASRVAPMRAVAARARPPRGGDVVWLLVIAIAAILTQVALLLIPQSEQTRFWLYVGLGLPLLATGYFLLSVPIFWGLTRVLGGGVGRALRLPPTLLRQTALSLPVRLGLTAGALMIGIAIFVASWTSTSSLLSDWLGQMQFADGFIYSRNGITPAQRDRIAHLDFVEDICPIGYMPLGVQNRHIFGVEGLAPRNVVCIGFEPELFFRVNRVKWVRGDPAEAIPRIASGEGILVAEEFIGTNRIDIGDTLELGAGDVTREFVVVGAVTAAGLDVATQMFGIRDAYHEHALSCVFADFDTVAETFDNPDVYIVQVNIADSVTDDEARETFISTVPGTLFVSGRGIKDALQTIGNTVLTVNTTLAFAALLLACVAVGNVLIANVAARQFEYAILRAVGGTRGLLLRLVYGEAALVALAAIACGTIFGLHAAMTDLRMQRDMLGLQPQLHISPGAIGIAWAVLMLLTLLAATPAALRLMRRTPRALLSAGRGGA